MIKIGIVTISDRASAGIYQDKSGPAIIDWLDKAMLSECSYIKSLISDEQNIISNTLIDIIDNQQAHIVFTTGGTGPSKRDITPEATSAVCDKIYDGFGQQMRQVSLRTVPTAILSRQIAGSRDSSLIVNLPGNPPSIAVCLSAIFLAIPKCLDLLSGAKIEIDKKYVNEQLQKTFS